MDGKNRISKVYLRNESGKQEQAGSVGGLTKIANYVWSTEFLDWVRMTQASGGGGGGDASAANQVLANTKLDSLIAKAQKAGTFTDRSDQAGAASAEIMPVNAARKFLFIQNLEKAANKTLWINFTSAATVGGSSIPLGPREKFILMDQFLTTEAINAISEVGTCDFVAKEG